jgi:hypothetical protein
MTSLTDPNLNILKKEPGMTEALELLRKDIFINFNCHAIGTVQSFDKNSQTAKVTINYTRTYYEKNPNGILKPIYVDYPVLADCPVVIVGGGDGHLTFPISKGNQCLIIFNDRSLDDWFENGIKTNLSASRMHSISDGIIIVGLHSRKNPIQNYDEDRAVLRFGNAAIGVRKSNDKVLISKNYPSNTQTLNTYLQSLITNLKNLITQVSSLTVTGVTAGGGTSGVPSNAAAINSISSQLTVDANNLSGLLE